MDMEYSELKKELRRKVQEKMDYGRDYSDREVEETIDEVLLEQEKLQFVPVEIRRHLRKELFDSLR